MIIQCVKCHTRFSVDSALLEGVDNPNFHCSRCDHYFFLNDKPEESKISFNEHLSSPSHRQLNFLDESDSDILEGEPGEMQNQDELLTTPEGSSDSKASWPDTHEDEDLETLYRPDSFAPDSQMEIESEKKETTAKAARNFFFKKSTPAEKTSESSEVNFTKKLKKPERISSSGFKPPKIVNTKKFKEYYSNKEKEPKRAQEKTPKDSFSFFSKLKANRSQSKASSLYKGTNFKLACILLLPALGLLGIYFLNKNISSLPSVAKIYLALKPGNLSNIPSPGVEIASLYSYNKNLEDGKKYLEFSGEILNSSPHHLEEAVVEVRLFDKSGKLLQQDFSSTKNKLANTKSLSALSSQAIKNLKSQVEISGKQSADSIKIGSIQPNGSRARFRSVILEPNEEASWFSARVYSTKNKQVF